jgi:hypothetical protein
MSDAYAELREVGFRGRTDEDNYAWNLTSCEFGNIYEDLDLLKSVRA